MGHIIKASFMHQYKDKAVYEREILLYTPSLNHYYTTSTIYLEFEMPLLLAIGPEWIYRWFKSGRPRYVTRRSLRVVGSDGVTLCELSKRPLKANLHIPQITDISPVTELPTIHICLVVEKDEIKELSKIFFK